MVCCVLDCVRFMLHILQAWAFWNVSSIQSTLDRNVNVNYNFVIAVPMVTHLPRWCYLQSHVLSPCVYCLVITIWGKLKKYCGSFPTPCFSFKVNSNKCATYVVEHRQTWSGVFSAGSREASTFIPLHKERWHQQNWLPIYTH
jgi:hypothetical protein